MQNSTHDTSNGHHRLDYIDGLRGIAALAVVLQHVIEWSLHFLPDASPIHTLLINIFVNWLNLGRVGVVAFFCISGFVIPFSLKGDAPIRTFIINRFFRLYPPYWLSMAVAVSLLPFWTGHGFSLRQIAANATMIQSILGSPNILGVYWTLSSELMFYAACLCAFMIGKLQKASYLTLVIVSLLVTGLAFGILRKAHLVNLPISIPLYLSLMHFGALVRLSALNTDPDGKRALIPVLVALLVTMGPIGWLGFHKAASFETLTADLFSSYVGVAIFLLVVWKRFFTSKIAVFLGAISFAIYLFHTIALEFSIWVAKMVIYPLNIFVLVVLTLGLTLIIAYLVHTTVELPFIKLGRRVSKSWSVTPKI